MGPRPPSTLRLDQPDVLSTIDQQLEPIVMETKRSRARRAGRRSGVDHQVGQEEAEASLSQFPAHELDEPAPKELARSETAGVKTEIAELRVEMHQLVNRLFVSLVGVMIGIAGFALAVARIA